jgi:biopolymer transport protein ExbD
MRLKRRKIKRGRIEIIPMIDTIVILLIFYMTFSRFSQAAKEASIVLPKSRAGEEWKKQPNQIIINMFTADRVKIAGDTYKVEELPGVMWNYLKNLQTLDPVTAADLKSGAKKPSIILRGDKSMTYKDLSEFLRVCAKADLREFLPSKAPVGIAEVTFTTEEVR